MVEAERRGVPPGAAVPKKKRRKSVAARRGVVIARRRHQISQEKRSRQRRKQQHNLCSCSFSKMNNSHNLRTSRRSSFRRVRVLIRPLDVVVVELFAEPMCAFHI
jgi:hypothetical protein